MLAPRNNDSPKNVIDTMQTRIYRNDMPHRIFQALALFFALLFLVLIPRANAQSALRRLTTAGDVMEFVWSPRSDALYVTRSGDELTLANTHAQITGDLYRLALDDAQSELLARNANNARPSPTAEVIAFARLSQDGSARLMEVQVNTKQTRDLDAVKWGATPQWNRTGDELYYAQNGKLTRAARAGRAAAFGAVNIPPDANVSPSGDRVVFVDAGGLVLVQDSTPRVLARSENDAHILPQVAWSRTGDRLAYILARENVKPELWIADITRGATQKIAATESHELEYFANLAWSPDDAFVVFTRTPTGSSVLNHSEIWRAEASGSDVRALTHNHAEETLPQYAPDGKSIAFLREGDVWVLDLNAQGMPVAENDVPENLAHAYKTPRAPDTPRTPPATIRVRHDAANGCRSVPVGQIETLDFETYVKRVVPAEVYPTWDDDALKTQAVAARSYAWYWVLQHSASNYDVTDTTAYQYMCDTRYASTDDATGADRKSVV